MKRVILTRGLPASGKTTWAKELLSNDNSFKRVNKDDLRAMLDDGTWSKSNEKFVVELRNYIITQSLRAGKSVIVDDTNLNPIHERDIRDLVKSEALVVIKDFVDVPLSTCLERDAKRANGVGERVIMRMYNQYIKPMPKNPEIIQDANWAIICDLDGTLSHLNGRDPYDASTCEKDDLDETIYSILSTYSRVPLILMSGRDEKYRPQTEKWLDAHRVQYSALWMRPNGDMRADYLVKQELYDNHIKGKINVLFVLDDRNQVVDMWRQNGLKCLQVADGDF